MVKTLTGEDLLTTDIQYSGKRCLAVCDRKCEKAWGNNGGRPAIVGDEEDDSIWLADGEVGEAPESHTWEAGQGKPDHPERHNKWCVRECERSAVIDVGQPIRCFDLSQRIYNQPWKHDRTDNPQLTTGTLFDPVD
jgi:hypothetical protein